VTEHNGEHKLKDHMYYKSEQTNPKGKLQVESY
jgi:hypothetical protein